MGHWLGALPEAPFALSLQEFLLVYLGREEDGFQTTVLSVLPNLISVDTIVLRFLRFQIAAI